MREDEREGESGCGFRRLRSSSPYSPNLVGGQFCELRAEGVLESSPNIFSYLAHRGMWLPPTTRYANRCALGPRVPHPLAPPRYGRVYPMRKTVLLLASMAVALALSQLRECIALAGKRRRYPRASSMPSAACLPMLGIQCEYRSRVMVIEACMRRCWTSFGWTPRPGGGLAQVCLRSCQRIGGGPCARGAA